MGRGGRAADVTATLERPVAPPKRAYPRRDWLLRLSALNLAGLFVLWGLERGLGERYWLTALLVYVPQAPFALPALLLALVALARRRWRALALNLGALAAAAFLLLHLALPAPFSAASLLLTSRRLAGTRRLAGFLGLAPPAGIPLRVLTFNVEHGKAGAPAIERAIRAARPDLFCL